jgi:D-alanyl-lipoteichoic acid acyltransferase DltB (MBOAT superfamily)
MLFSNPDYPVFLIAVFFLYALSRGHGAGGVWARSALMVLLGDLVFVLVSKDPRGLWDPLGGLLYQQIGHLPLALDDAWRWPLGCAVLAVAIWSGRRGSTWVTRERMAYVFVLVLATLGAQLLHAVRTDTLAELTATLVRYGHLALLFVLGIAIGASQVESRRSLGRILVLFVVSALFYHAWAAAMPGVYRYLLGLLLSTIVLDYYLAIWIEGSTNPTARKLLVLVSVLSNLGILFFFKYADFVTHDVLHLDVDRLDLILPAGISFHTFQSLSYTIDVYRKELPATRSVVQFATFVLFFPQLVAGPIVRAQDLMPQLDTLPALELEKATRGLFRIVVGLFKKIALADTLAVSIVDRVFEAPERFSSLETLGGVYGYALQIYLDFSAYSDIAIGSAMVLGFTLPENFRTPYRSANIQEFWRRWHISLSTWLRDYLYIALGGSRGAEWRTYLNLILTMLLGGLWHGASWAFIVWGGLHGFGLAITRYFQRITARDMRAALRMRIACSVLAAIGCGVLLVAADDASTWTRLIIAWLFITPLWAVLTAWLGRESKHERDAPVAPSPVAESLRLAMCSIALTFLVALKYWDSSTWIPLALLMWGLGIAADLVERNARDTVAELRTLARRTFAVILVFHYVCLAWVFFRATTFDGALAVLRRLGALELDHANLVPMVTTALVVGFLCHFFADGSFRWLRDRFAALPAWAQGGVLAAAVPVLGELSHAKHVPFIYFQF